MVFTNSLKIALVFIFLILLTRVSHELTLFSFPDASLIIFFAGGIFLKKIRWLMFFLAYIVCIDLYIINFTLLEKINLNIGYLLHLSIYPLCWIVSKKLYGEKNNLNVILFFSSIIFVTIIAYFISTSSYYFLSGWVHEPNISGSYIFLKANFLHYFIPNLIYGFILFSIIQICKKVLLLKKKQSLITH
ncbi:MAG: hypothetical protein CMH24_02225 [Nitrosomonadales bacterium]|nr:hypothetical protein [Nitrosomonadales bacterium]|tara:strand:+ start:1004 stop:1570 length:567 start_codon:yes stop_codon:yes gene_type:complete